MTEPMKISDLRAEMKLGLADFCRLLGLTSMGHASEIERANRCAVRVALRIEELSGGRIDAADLNADVRAVRVGLGAVHAAPLTPGDAAASSGKSGDLTDAATLTSDRTCPHPSGGTGAGSPTGESRTPAPDNLRTGAAA